MREYNLRSPSEPIPIEPADGIAISYSSSGFPDLESIVGVLRLQNTGVISFSLAPGTGKGGISVGFQSENGYWTSYSISLDWVEIRANENIFWVSKSSQSTSWNLGINDEFVVYSSVNVPSDLSVQSVSGTAGAKVVIFQSDSTGSNLSSHIQSSLGRSQRTKSPRDILNREGTIQTRQRDLDAKEISLTEKERKTEEEKKKNEEEKKKLEEEKKKNEEEKKKLEDEKKRLDDRERRVAARERNAGNQNTNPPSANDVHPADYDAFQFATSTAWPRAVSIILRGQGIDNAVKNSYRQFMTDWVAARGDNLSSDAYDYLTYSHGVAWAIGKCRVITSTTVEDLPCN